MHKQSAKKVILVTGGSRGIGRAVVQKFQEEGWKVAACGTDASRLVDSSADFNFVCDVSQLEQVKQGVQKVVQEFGRIDALVNNAGQTGNDSMDPNTSDENWHRAIQVNLYGTYAMSKQVIPHLPDHTGRIVNIASVLALKGVPDAIAYCAAKHGVVGLTRSLAQFLAPRKITINAVCPGWVRTDMANARMQRIGVTEKDFETSVPLGRFIEPSEIADFVHYLISAHGAAMITGQALTLDGGFLT